MIDQEKARAFESLEDGDQDALGNLIDSLIIKDEDNEQGKDRHSSTLQLP